MIVSISGSGCWSARGAAWNATTRCATRWRGPTTCSMTRRRRCWSGVRCSPVDSTSKAPARSRVPMIDFATLDLLDALVRKSLLVADRSSGRTRFSMLETIRQFAEEQLVACGAATEVRTAHARYFAGREADILALWDSPRQRDAYDWFTTELANLRTAFRWAADQGDLDAAAAIATYAGFLGYWSRIMSRWPGPRSSSSPPAPSTIPGSRFLYVMASQCFTTGRIEEAVGYAEAAQTVIGSGGEGAVRQRGQLGAVYMAIGQPERGVEWCRAQLARGRDTHTLTRYWLVATLAMAGGR